MTTVAQILHSVRARLTDPRHWIQGTYAGIRTRQGTVIPFWQHRDIGKATCWCIGTAITMALSSCITALGDVAWTELRSDVERELLLTLDELGVIDNCGRRHSNIAQFNDDLRTSHAAVLDVIDRTLQRLPEAA